MTGKYGYVQKGSFRGVKFETFDAEMLFGRRNVCHEYPLKDDPFTEDLGRKAREYTFNAYVIGGNLLGARNALIKAVEDEESPGTLIHPTLGSISVYPKDCRIRFDNRAGGIEYFTLNFIEAGKASYPSGGASTSYLSNFFSSSAITSLISHFASTFLTKNLPDFLHDSALTQLVGNPLNVSNGNNGSFTSLVRSTIASGNFGAENPDYTTLNESLDKLEESATTDLDTPETLATNISVIITQLTNVFLNQPVVVNTIDTFLYTVLPNHPEAYALRAQKRLQTFGDMFAEIPLTTDPRIQQAENQAQLINLIRHCSLCEMMRITSTIDFASRQDAVEVRDIVDSYILPRLTELADSGDDDPYLALNKARSAMIKDVNTRAATLKNKKYVLTNDAMPAIVFAYDEYEDATQDLDVIRRNRIRNPCFIPPLTNVEVIV